MPGQGQPIIVGGGISLIGGAIDEFLVLSTVTPPAATTSPRIRRNGSDIIIESVANRFDTVMGSGAAGSVNAGASVVIGQTVTAAPSAGAGPGVVVGQNSTFTSTGEFVVVGHNLTVDGSDQVVIGHVTTKSVGFGSSGVHIGTQLVITGTTNSAVVQIGRGASSGGNSSVLIGDTVSTTGNGAVAIGANAQAGLNSISIGQLATTGTGGAANSISIGTNSTGPAGVSQWLNVGNRAGAAGTIVAGDITFGHQDNTNNVFSLTLWLGGGPDHKAATAVPDFNIKGRQASGANLAAGNFIFNGQRGTGTGTPGGFTFFTTSTTGAGSGQQAFTERLRIPGAGTGLTIFAPVATGVSLSIGGFGGAGVGVINFTNLTSGAAAAAGTLLNAPSAGNPSFWLPIQIAGATRYIPCWT